MVRFAPHSHGDVAQVWLRSLSCAQPKSTGYGQTARTRVEGCPRDSRKFDGRHGIRYLDATELNPASHPLIRSSLAHRSSNRLRCLRMVSNQLSKQPEVR